MLLKARSVGQPFDIHEDCSARNGQAADKPHKPEQQGAIKTFHILQPSFIPIDGSLCMNQNQHQCQSTYVCLNTY